MRPIEPVDRTRNRSGRTRATWAFGLLAVVLGSSACSAPREEVRPETAGGARRIVVMAPAAAEMLESLGALDRVVGVGDFVSGPAALEALPRVGAYNAPSIERIAELRADLFLTSSSEAAATAHGRLEALGVRVVALDTSTFDGVFAALSSLGQLLGRQERAGALAEEMHRDLERVRRVAEGLPPRRVLCVVGRNPLYVAGPGSHIDEMISLVGGENVFGDGAAPWLRVSMEAALERLPEVIVDISDNRPGALLGRVPGDWGEWEFVPAVRDGRVYRVAPSRLAIPGVRLPAMTRLLARLVQPEAFGEATDQELMRQ